MRLIIRIHGSAGNDAGYAIDLLAAQAGMVKRRCPSGSLSNMERVAMPQSQRGQGMVEYIIIVALIALAAIGAFSYFGKSVRRQTAQMSAQVAGTGSDTGQSNASTAAGKAEDESGEDYGLGNFNDADDDMSGGGGGGS